MNVCLKLTPQLDVNKMPARTPFELSAERLLRSAPESVYRSFLQDLEKASHEADAELRVAPSDQILRMQGYAQAYAAFLRLFKECTIQRASERPKPAPAQ